MANHEDTLQALNDGTKTLGDLSDVVALNDYANSHPEIGLAGNLRADLNTLASAEPSAPKKKRVHTRSKSKSKAKTKPKDIAPVVAPKSVTLEEDSK